MNFHVLSAILINASYAPIIVFLLSGRSFVTLVFTNQLVAFLAAGLITLVFFRTQFKDLIRRMTWSIFTKIIIAGIFFVAFNLSFLYALQTSNPIDVNLIGEAWPAFLFVGLLLVRRTKAKVNPAKFVALAIGTLGALTIAGGNTNFAFLQIDTSLLIALSAAVWGGLNNVFVIWAADLVSEENIIEDRVASAVCLEVLVRAFVSVAMIGVLLVSDIQISIDFSVPEVVGILYCGIFVAAIQNILWTIGMDDAHDISDSILAFISPLLSFVALAIFTDASIALVSVFGGVMVIFANILINVEYSYFNASRLLSVPFLFLISLICLYAPTLGIDRPTSISSLSLVFSIVVGFTISVLSLQAREIRGMISDFVFTQPGISASTRQKIEAAAVDANSFSQIKAALEDVTSRDRPIVDRRFKEVSRHIASVRYYNVGFVAVVVGVVFILIELMLREVGLVSDIVTIFTCAIAAMICLYVIDLTNLRLLFRVLMTNNELINQKIVRLNLIQFGVAMVSSALVITLIFEKYAP